MSLRSSRSSDLSNSAFHTADTKLFVTQITKSFFFLKRVILIIVVSLICIAILTKHFELMGVHVKSIQLPTPGDLLGTNHKCVPRSRNSCKHTPPKSFGLNISLMEIRALVPIGICTVQIRRSGTYTVEICAKPCVARMRSDSDYRSIFATSPPVAQ